MAFTYRVDPTVPPTDRDRLRLLLSDTNETTPAWMDEDLDVVLATRANTYLAAAFACDILSMRYAGDVDHSMGNSSVSSSQRSASYAKRADAFRKLATRAGNGMAGSLFFIGGRTHTEKLVAASNPSAVQPASG